MNELVKCPICRKTWLCDGKEYRLYSGVYIPRPTRLGICTCPSCEDEPVPEHIPPNGSGTVDEPNPSQENAVRAMER